MQKQELYQAVMAKVADITDLPTGIILNSITEQGTDARFLLVRALYKLGFTDTEMAERIGRSRQAVAHLRTGYKRTGKWLLENQWQTLVKWMENDYFHSK